MTIPSLWSNITLTTEVTHMTDLTHLNSLLARLSNEKMRLENDNSEIRKVWILQLEKEIEGEYKFLGIQPTDSDTDLTNEQLLNELFK